MLEKGYMRVSVLQMRIISLSVLFVVPVISVMSVLLVLSFGRRVANGVVDGRWRGMVDGKEENLVGGLQICLSV